VLTGEESKCDEPKAVFCGLVGDTGRGECAISKGGLSRRKSGPSRRSLGKEAVNSSEDLRGGGVPQSSKFAV